MLDKRTTSSYDGPLVLIYWSRFPWKSIQCCNSSLYAQYAYSASAANMEALETGDGRQHPATDEVRFVGTEQTGTEAPFDVGTSLPTQMETNEFEHKEVLTPLVPCRMEALNASPSHSEDETEEGGAASDKDDDDLEDEEEMDATPVQANNSDSEENAGRGTYCASFNLDEMMDIGTVDQQEQEAQMSTEDNFAGGVFEEDEAKIESDVDMNANLDEKAGEEKEEANKEEVIENQVNEEKEEANKEEAIENQVNEEKEEANKEEKEHQEDEEKEEANKEEAKENQEEEEKEEANKEEAKVNQEEEEKEEADKEEPKEIQEDEAKEKEEEGKQEEIKEKEEEAKQKEAGEGKEEAKRKEADKEKKEAQEEKQVVGQNEEASNEKEEGKKEEKEQEKEEEKKAEEEEKKEEKKEEERAPFYATRSRSRSAKSPASASDMTNGKLLVSASSSSSSSSPPLIKIKDEPMDEEYEQAHLSGAISMKDEPFVAKEEDLQIDSVYSVTPDGDGRRQRGVRGSSSALNMSCAHCRMGLLKGQTAYQRKGSPALFCSANCLTSSLSSPRIVKTCYRCQKRIFRPQDVILAPDVDGVTRDFCSEMCLSAFNHRKNSSASDNKPQSQCSMCGKIGISKHEVPLGGTNHSMCSDSCFTSFRTTHRLTMAGCANCEASCPVKPLLLKMEGSSKTLCNVSCLINYKKKTKITLSCTMCHSPRPLADMIHNKSTDDSVSLFCSSSCIMAFTVQSVSSSGAQMSCENCGKNALPAYHLAMSDTSIRNFCSLSCVMTFQEKFKVKQKQGTVYPKLSRAANVEQSTEPQPLPQGAAPTLSCAQCARTMSFKPDVIHVKDKVVFVCGWSCALEFKTTKNVSAKCEYCKQEKISREVKRINGKDCSFCSHGCKLLYEHELDALWGKHCKSCSYCQCVSKNLEKALYGESNEEFCSEDCRSNYTMLFCHVAKCASCGRKGKLKHSLILLGEVRNFCDLPCLLRYCNLQVKTQGEVFPQDSPVIANVVSLADTTAADKPTKQSMRLLCKNDTPPPDTPVRRRRRGREESNPSTVVRGKGAESQTDSDVIVINDSPVKKTYSSTTTHSTTNSSKSMKNKALLCKPLVQNKGISCRTQTVDVESQTELTIPKVMMVPIPVPVYVPIPMNMYSQWTPKPLGFPLPLPVPMFLPVTMNNADRIVDTIKKIKDKFPEDPFEAELVLMAEMVSETNGDKETRPGTAAGGDGISTYSDDLDTADLASLLNSWDDPNVPGPPLDIENDFPVEVLEKMSQQREPSPASPVRTSSRKRQASRKVRESRGRKKSSKSAEASGKKGSGATNTLPNVLKLKSEYGVDAWKRWIRWRDTQPDLEQPPRIGMRQLVLKEDILSCNSAEVSYGLCQFINEVKRPSGERYKPDSLFYLCLGIQQHLFENGRVENIFTDSFYSRFSNEFTNMLRGFQPSLTASGYIHTRVEEEFLWDCKQLGVYSPIVLLNTLLFFFCKNFGFTTPEQHRQLSFAHVMRCTKTGQGNVKTTFLRFYPPIDPNEEMDGAPAKRRRENEDERDTREEKILEMKENTENPLRCPVRLYEFYLSKCSDTVKQRTDVFYLLPERCCVPNSPLWFSATPLDEETKEAMLTRILVVRQMQEALKEQTFDPEDYEDKDEYTGGGGGGGGGDDDEDDLDWL
ncbi:zinc finger MYM-type protein 4-like isoform X2 [Corythoichthys intestinalis]|uniref:zinc finger MYM-type protein 4-like isoform X2 n=1 Tax=Corythoichthys intestinalis TaxID=161448 RepID=UPI0025A53FC0|nr:zinc finger MYM-type protein 4-like isoform X2 [Corythoichthys intestinalis]